MDRAVIYIKFFVPLFHFYFYFLPYFYHHGLTTLFVTLSPWQCDVTTSLYQTGCRLTKWPVMATEIPRSHVRIFKKVIDHDR